MKREQMKEEQIFGILLSEIRKNKSISQEKLSKITGLDRTFISLIETGKRNPTLTTITKIANGLDIKLRSEKTSLKEHVKNSIAANFETLQDVNEDAIFNENDAIFIAVGDSIDIPPTDFGDLKVGWSVSFFRDTTIAEEDQRPPEIGEVFTIVTKKTFRSGEYFEFMSKAQDFDISKASSDLDKIAVVPNPYAGAASWEPFSNAVGRGERRINFIHLPNECTIRVYTISGKLVQTLQHSGTISDGQEAWNLISKDGMDIAYGIYVYHVEAPGIGEKIGRFAIIK